LDRRIIYPQVVIYGNLQNGIKTLLDQNAINPTDPNRKISNLIFSPSEDPRILEMTIEGQYYGENLYDTISLICMEKQIGFMITLNEQFQFVFSLYMGQDRSYEQFDNPYIIFSPMFNNIISSNYINSLKPVKNVAYVGGEGEGSDRVFVTVGDNTNLARKEIFVDAKSLSSKYEGGTMPPEEYQKQLVQRGNEELANHVADMMFDGEVAEYFMYLYGRDYQMGDIVQLENEYGMEARSRVTEVIKSQNVSDGINIFPTFTKVN
jgi:hypothetical protein